MIDLRSVPHYDIADTWYELEPHITALLEQDTCGTMTPDSIRRALIERDMQVLVPVDEENNIIGVALTEIRREMSGLRTFNIVGLGGARFDEWRDEGDRVLRAWARSVDAPVVQLIGRRGWVKKLADLGWKEEAVIMRLDLRN